MGEEGQRWEDKIKKEWVMGEEGQRWEDERPPQPSHLLLDVQQRLLKQSLLHDGQSGSCREAVDEGGGLVGVEAHGQHEDEEVVEEEAEESVLLQTKRLPVRLGEGVVPKRRRRRRRRRRGRRR